MWTRAVPRKTRAEGQRCGPRTMDMKRDCSAGLSRNMPVKRLVNVVAPCLATPRTDMQVCSASIITATPRGFNTSSIAAAIWAVRCSWVCRRRAKMSVRRASFDHPARRIQEALAVGVLADVAKQGLYCVLGLGARGTRLVGANGRGQKFGWIEFRRAYFRLGIRSLGVGRL